MSGSTTIGPGGDNHIVGRSLNSHPVATFVHIKIQTPVRPAESERYFLCRAMEEDSAK